LFAPQTPPEPYIAPITQVIVEVVETPPDPISEAISAIIRISREHGVDETLALEIAEAESNFRMVKNPESTAFGVFQFLEGTWEEQCNGDREDLKDNVTCGIEMIERGELWRWFASKEEWDHALSEEESNALNINCSCMVYLAIKGIKLEGDARDLVVNSAEAKVGNVMVFQYGSTVNESHAVLIEAREGDMVLISETNYERCKFSRRWISINSPFLRGYIDPSVL